MKFVIKNTRFSELIIYIAIIFLALFFHTPLSLSIIYIISLITTLFYVFRIKQLKVFSIYGLSYLIFNAYVISPVFNYLVFDKALFIPAANKLYEDPNLIFFSEYIRNSTIGIIIYSFISTNISARIVHKGLRLNYKKSIILIFTGLFLLFFTFYITGAIKYVASIENRYLVRQTLNTVLPYYIYFLLPGIYLFMKEVGLESVPKLISLFIVFVLLSYSLFWISIGLRGNGLYTIIIMLIGYFRYKEFRLSKYKWYVLGLFTVFILYSIKVRMPKEIKNPDISQVVSFVKKNPKFVNPGTIEYGTSYYNYSIMKNHNFEQEYPFQIYIEGFISPLVQILLPKEKQPIPLFYKYRDIFFKNYKTRLGKSGGTGFSLQYEFEMVLGKYFYWILYLIIGAIFLYIDYNSFFKGHYWELFLVLLIPYIITIARSNINFIIFITRFGYAYIFYFGLVTVFYKKNTNE